MFDIISKPKFVHNCDNCLFLGCHKEFDVYFCPDLESYGGGSVILRYGDEVENYSSSPISVALYGKELTKAAKIRKDVAAWLLFEGMVKISLNSAVIENKREIWGDRWEMRK